MASPVMHDDDDDDDDDDPQFQTVSRITLSFAPDGTSISRYQSSLYSSFSHLMTPAELEAIFLKAFQTWAQHSAVNVGVVPDSGDDFGIGGASQGDPRFGDIRIGAVPMAGDVFAVAVPSIDFVSGTWAGDLLFNSNANFANAEQFYAVALHEAGHVLGLGHTTDETSVMHPTALNSVLNSNDILELKALYGERVDLDQYDQEGDNNNSFDGAEEIENRGSVDGIIPLLVYGDIEDANDVDVFALETRSNYTGPVTFRLISQTVSFLRAKISVYDEDLRLVGEAESDSIWGTDVSFQNSQHASTGGVFCQSRINRRSREPVWKLWAGCHD